MFEVANTQIPMTPAMQTQTAGTTTLSNKVYDIFAVPPVLTYTSVSNNGAGAGNVTQYIFNNSFLNAAVTNNGSGAASIVNTYGDGFSGNAYARALSSWNGGRGIGIKGFTLAVTNTTSGAQNGSQFNTMSFTLLSANMQGGTTPVPIDLSAAINNVQQQVGIISPRQAMFFNAISQFSFLEQANSTYAFTFFTESSQF